MYRTQAKPEETKEQKRHLCCSPESIFFGLHIFVHPINPCGTASIYDASKRVCLYCGKLDLDYKTG